MQTLQRLALLTALLSIFFVSAFGMTSSASARMPSISTQTHSPLLADCGIIIVDPPGVC